MAKRFKKPLIFREKTLQARISKIWKIFGDKLQHFELFKLTEPTYTVDYIPQIRLMITYSDYIYWFGYRSIRFENHKKNLYFEAYVTRDGDLAVYRYQSDRFLTHGYRLSIDKTQQTLDSSFYWINKLLR